MSGVEFIEVLEENLGSLLREGNRLIRNVSEILSRYVA